MTAPESARNLRALVLTPDFPPAPGGIQLLVRRLLEELEPVDATVLTLDTPGAAEFDSRSTLDVRRVAWNGSARRRMAVARLNAAGVRTALSNRPQVVISGHAVTAPAAAAIRASFGAPTVQYVHGDEFRGRPHLLRFAVRRADAVIAVSEHSCAMTLGAGADPARVHLVHPGVDLPQAPPQPREELPTVVTVARLHDRYKGHDQMIRAMPLIRARVPAVQWIVIGDGPLRPELEALAAAYGVAKSVKFLGAVPAAERDAWLARSHVFAMPSRLPREGVGGEGFGIVYLEAGASGLPVVAGAEGGALDAVVEGETGHLVDPTDPRAIADAVADLLLDPEQALGLGRAGAARARRFTWRAHAESVERILRDLVPPRQ